MQDLMSSAVMGIKNHGSLQTVCVELVVGSRLTVRRPPAALAEKLITTFQMVNPVWTENQKAGRWNGDTDRVLEFYTRQSDGTIIVPRGALGLVAWLARQCGCRWRLTDRRRTLPDVSSVFTGHLKPYQVRAVEELGRRDFGFLQAPTGAGKTVMALSLIAKRRQPALIVVHTRELVDQWVQRIETFLGLPRDQIGVVGDGRLDIGRSLTVATVQSLYKVAPDVAPHVGHLIVDECHRCPSRTFTKAITSFDCRYMLGLSATPWRRDGLTKLIAWHLGRKVEVDRSELGADDLIFNVEVIERLTDFDTDLDASEQYVQVVAELTQDADRNEMIADDVATEATGHEGVCLVLSDRKSHCETLRDLIEQRGVRTDVLTGDLSKSVRTAVVERVRAGEVPVLVATAQLIGEGFDAKSLRCLFLTTPMTFDGRVLQALGRILRPAPGKATARVFDYVDERIGVLKHAARRRRRVYADLAVGSHKE